MLCRACRLAPPSYVRAVSNGVYQGRIKQAIHALKYDRLHSSARQLGRMLANAIAQLAAEAPAEMLVVPVPLHRSKYAQRGFNQSRLLAVEAIQILRKTHPQWRLSLAPSTLMRLRATDSQAGLTPRGRRINVRGAFSVSDSSRVKAQNILLVDDILTTGATARAAAQALINAGAASVWVATLARAQRSTLFSRDSNSLRDLSLAPDEGSYDYVDEETYEDGEILTGPATHSASSDSTSKWDQPSFYSVFDSPLNRTSDAEWQFPQEIATLRDDGNDDGNVDK